MHNTYTQMYICTCALGTQYCEEKVWALYKHTLNVFSAYSHHRFTRMDWKVCILKN